MTEVGEATGALQDMLNSLADFYDEEIETNLERFVTLVEPVLLITMGIVIAGLLLALYMPLFQLSSVLVTGPAKDVLMETVNRPTPTLPDADASLDLDAAEQRRPRSRRRGGSPSATGSSSSTWTQFRIDHELFRSIPADLMLRYGFVPYRREGKSLVIVVSDPTDLPMIDELAVLLGDADQGHGRRRASAIQSILKKSESSQRVLEEATEELPAPAAARKTRTARTA